MATTLTILTKKSVQRGGNHNSRSVDRQAVTKRQRLRLSRPKWDARGVTDAIILHATETDTFATAAH